MLRAFLFGSALLVLTGLAGCSETLGVRPPRGCNFPVDTVVAVVGQTPLSDIGLAPRGRSPDPPGVPVYVTSAPISLSEGTPSRWFCVVYDLEQADGLTSATGPVPEGWTPPGE